METVKIITIHDIGNNFGSTLQACALCEYIKSLGFDVELIDYKPKYAYHNGIIGELAKWIFFPRSMFLQKKRFKEYLRAHSKLTNRYTDFNDISLEKADIFIVGSDQVWNEFYEAGKDPAYYLEFTQCKRKIAYSTSLGQLHTEEELDRLIKKIEDFQFVSVREEASKVQLNNKGLTEVCHVLDPVFLQEPNYYLNNNYSNSYGDYLLVYSINNDELMDYTAKVLSERLKLKIVMVGGYLQKNMHDFYLRDAGPIEFCNLINNAKFVLANSFHATAMSIILNKQFGLVLSNNSPLRLTDMLETAGISGRIVKEKDEVDSLFDMIDYTAVNKTIEQKIIYSKQFLRKALGLDGKTNQ